MYLQAIFLLTWAAAFTASTLDESASRPPVFAHPGQIVTLPCRPPSPLTSSSDLALEWIHLCGSEERSVFLKRGSDVLRKDIHEQYRHRSTLTGEHDLTLHPVQIQDNGTHSCVIRKGPTVLHQEFIQLIIVEASEVNITTSRSTNELLVGCESTGWNPKPLVSLMESNGNKLHADVDFTFDLDGLYAFSATLSVNTTKGMLTGDGKIICKAEIPEIGLVKRQSAFIEDVSRFKEAGFDLWIIGAVVTAVVMIIFMFYVRKFLIWKYNQKMAEKARLEGSLFDPARLEGSLFGPDRLEGSGETDEESKEDEDDEHAEVLWADFIRVGAVMFAWGAPLFAIAARRAKGKVHGDIMEMKTKGAIGTARVSGLTITGVKASEVLAERTLGVLMKIKQEIVRVAKQHHVHAALVGGIISRQYQMRLRFGRARLSRNCLERAVAYLCELLDAMTKTKEGWSEEQLLRGALVCFTAGKDAVADLAPEDLDAVTPHGDYADDVIARAQWLAHNGL